MHDHGVALVEVVDALGLPEIKERQQCIQAYHGIQVGRQTDKMAKKAKWEKWQKAKWEKWEKGTEADSHIGPRRYRQLYTSNLSSEHKSAKICFLPPPFCPLDPPLI